LISKGEFFRASEIWLITFQVVSEIYFASGAGAERYGRSDGQRPFTYEEKVRFYHEASHILDELAEVGLPSLAHHLLETLEAFIPSDPAGVFLRIGRVIRGGQKGGYQYESLAVDLMVRSVEQYLNQTTWDSYT
jgi:hypothetical protein